MSVEQFHAWSDLIPDPVLLVSSDGTILAANRAGTALIGGESSVAGRHLSELVDEPREELESYLRQCAAGSGKLTRTLALGRATQSRTFHCEAMSLRNGQWAEPSLILRLATGLTAGSLQQESLEWHRAIAELTSDFAATSRVEADGRVVIEAVTDGFVKTTGYTLEQLEAAGGWPVLIHPEDLPTVEESIARLLRGEPHASEIRLLTRDGQVRWLRYLGRPERDPRTGQVCRLYSAGQDISEQRLAEFALREQREWLRVTLDSIGDAVITTDTRGHVTFLNPIAETLTGWKLAEAQSRPLEDVFRILHEHTGEPVENPVLKVLKTGQIVGLGNHTVLIAKDGQQRAIDDSAAPIRNVAGETIGVVLVFRDVSEQRLTEHALQESEARKAAVLQTALDGIITIDHEGRVLEINPAAERLFGYRREDVLGQPMAELVIPPELRPQHYAGLARYLATGQARVLNQRLEVPALRADGSRFTAELAITRIPLQGPPVFTAYVRDVSEIKRVERRRNARLAVTQILAESQALDEAVPGILSAIGESVGWEVGGFWNVQPQDDRLECLYVWHQPQVAVEAFEQVTRQMRFPRGVGLPGRTWDSGKPHWILDLAVEANFPRAPVAREVGLRSAFASPLMLGSECVGVIEFFSRERREPDADLLEMVATLGGQIGQFVERRRAEAAVREREEQLALALAAGRLGTWHLDLTDLTFTCSEECRAILGVQPGIALNYEVCLDVLHPDDCLRVRDALQEAINRHTDYEAEYRVIWPDGTVRWVAARGRATYGPDHQPLSVNGVLQDITERKQSEIRDRFLAEIGGTFVSSLDYEKLLEKVAELSVPTMADVCFFDLTNGERMQRVGWKAAGMAGGYFGQQMVRFVPRRESTSHPVVKAMRTGEPVFVPVVSDEWMRSVALSEEHYQFLRKLQLRSLITVPLKIGDECLGAFTCAFGESGRYFTATDLRLAEEVAHRAALTVHNARLFQQVREADRRKNEFLAMLAHELRNPLAPIRSGLDILAMEDPQSEIVELMKRQVEHLVRLVDDLLDVSRIMRGKVELRKEPIEIEAIVTRAVETVRNLIDSQRQQLTVDLPPQPVWLDADVVRMTQVVGNLLNNAAKYTEPGGQVTIHVQPEADQVRLHVRDTGIGIEPELLPRIFDLFTQSERAIDRSQGGLGVGLTVVKNLVEMHGGTIKAWSEGAGQGSVFTITLPVLRQVQESRPPVDNLAAGGSHRILIVDDNVAAAKLLRMLLERLGEHEIQVAYDGPSALELAQAQRPDIVLLDLGLPRMDGYEVARRLRQQPAGQPQLLIALTGYGTEDDRRKSLAAGFDEHLVKPPGIEAIRSVLAHPKLSHS